MANTLQEQNQIEPRAVIGAVNVWCRFDELAPIGGLVGHPRNANKHPKAQIEKLAKIIAGNGFRACVTVSKRSGYIVKGHGRLMAAKHLKLEQAPVEFQDYADESAELADLLADNRIAELAELDASIVDDILSELQEIDFDIELTGFDVQDVPQLDDAGEVAEEQIKSFSYQIIVECNDQQEQAEVIDSLEKRGLKCRPLIL